MNYGLSGIKLLLVEDNEINRDMAVELLNTQGVLTEIAKNGLEAVQKIEEDYKGNKYHLVLMDLQMPVMNGFEATKIIRKKNKSLPIIAMTSCALKDNLKECLSVGMNDYLMKPLEPAFFFTVIRNWVYKDKSIIL